MDFKRNRKTLRAFQKPRIIRAVFRVIGAVMLLILWIGSQGNPLPEGADLWWFIGLLTTALWMFIQSFRLGLKAKPTGFVYRGFFATRKIPYEQVQEFFGDDASKFLIFDLLIGSWSEAVVWPTIIKKDGTTVSLYSCAMNFISEEMKEDKLNQLFNPPELALNGEQQLSGEYLPPFQGKWE